MITTETHFKRKLTTRRFAMLPQNEPMIHKALGYAGMEVVSQNKRAWTKTFRLY